MKQRGHLGGWFYGQCLTLILMAFIKMVASIFGFEGIGFFYSCFGWLLWLPILAAVIVLTSSDYFKRSLAEVPRLTNLAILFAAICSFFVIIR
jgi:hypothetical protein